MHSTKNETKPCAYFIKNWSTQIKKHNAHWDKTLIAFFSNMTQQTYFLLTSDILVTFECLISVLNFIGSSRISINQVWLNIYTQFHVKLWPYLKGDCFSLLFFVTDIGIRTDFTLINIVTITFCRFNFTNKFQNLYISSKIKYAFGTKRPPLLQVKCLYVCVGVFTGPTHAK